MNEAAATLARPAVPRHVPEGAYHLSLAELSRLWQQLRNEAENPLIPYEQSCIAADLSAVMEDRMLAAPVRALADVTAFVNAYARHMRELNDGTAPFRFDDDALGALFGRMATYLNQNA